MADVVETLLLESCEGNLWNSVGYCISGDVSSLSNAILVESRPQSDSAVDDDFHAHFTTFSKELELIVAMEGLIEKGGEYADMLYSYRSVSQAIPEIAIDQSDSADSKDKHKDNDDRSITSFLSTETDLSPTERAGLVQRKAEINGKISEVLRSEMSKLKELYFFTQNAISAFHNTAVSVAKAQKDQTIPEELIRITLRLLDQLIILDVLKEFKPSLQKDFSRFKRVLGTNQSIEVLEEIQLLQSFLAPQDFRKSRHFIIAALRESLQRADCESFLFDCIDAAVNGLENVLFVLPEERFRFLRVLPVLLVLIDGDKDGSNRATNVFRHPRCKSSMLQKWIRRYPIVPIIADVSMTLESILHLCSHYEKGSSNQWTSERDSSDRDKMPADYDLLSLWPAIRDSHSAFCARFTTVSSSAMSRDALKPSISVDGVEDSHAAFSIQSDGLQKMCRWATHLQLFLCWKYSHPTPNASISSQEGKEYASVIKDNLSENELYALVDVISMIRSQSTLLQQSDVYLSPLSRSYIHHRVQRLVQADFTPLLHRLDKRHKPILPTLLKVRALAADWANGIEPSGDYKNYSRRQGSISSVKHPSRCVAPSRSQLLLLRMQISALCESESEVRRRSSIFSKADLEKSDIEIFAQFLMESFLFSYVLQTADHCRRIIDDLGMLWFREFFLEMSRCVQFPIDLSLPWICVDYVLRASRAVSPMLDKLPMMLDVYNCAAELAIRRFQLQYLYDEVEAEANLALEQSFFLLCEEIYICSKDNAAVSLMDDSLRMRLEETRPSFPLVVKIGQFKALLSQKSLPLLGRSIDLTLVCTQTINAKFRRDIDIAIRRFESSPISHIGDLTTLLQILRKTHDDLSENLALDDFDSMCQEVDESLSPTSYRGRVSLHVLNALARDVIPNWAYNSITSRFVPSPIPVRPVEFASAPKQVLISQTYGTVCSRAYESSGKLLRDFFGKPHFDILCKGSLLGNAIPLHWEMILDQLAKNLLDKIIDICEYFEALRDGVPPFKLPSPQLGSIGAYGYFESHLRPLLMYDDLQPEVFQTLREIGNSMAFFRELSIASDSQRVLDSMVLRPLFSVSSSLADEININADSVLRMSPLVNIMQQTHSEILSNTEMLKLAALSAEPLQKIPPMLNRALESRFHTSFAGVEHRNTFRWMLLQVEEFLYQQSFGVDWAPSVHDTAGQRGPYFGIDIERDAGFARLWSALNFLFCINDGTSTENAYADSSSTDISNAAEFGHGFAIAGCMFLHMLAQRQLFELLDFTGQVVRLHEYEHISKVSSGTLEQAKALDSALLLDTSKFVTHASFQMRLQLQWFAIFEQTHVNRPSYVKSSVSDIKFHPPANLNL